jgi:formate dehydrogenase major subunit
VVTTYRLTEHHTSGAMSRWIPWLSELQPELFCEISPELAAEKGVSNAGWVTITTSRGSIHTIGLPYHWGPNGVVSGDVVNDILPVALEANVAIHEAKAFTANLEAGRV